MFVIQNEPFLRKLAWLAQPDLELEVI